MVVMALGLLGVVGVQMRTLADTQTGVRRAQAIRLIEDLSERAKVNPSALANINEYVIGFGSAGTPTKNCKTGSCNSSELAQYDISTWKQAVADTLPLGDASVFLSADEATPGNQRQLGVMISWRENERTELDATDRQNTDATQVRANDGTFSAGAGSAASCPANRSCQLQYLPVAARCAPDLREGTANPKYFCAGP